MNYRTSRLYAAPVPKMPPGLIELMQGLTRDVLKNNPTNIYEFCADHMEKLIKIRDETTRTSRLNLRQKIENAQKIVKERAKQRREKYDENLKTQHVDPTIVEFDISSSMLDVPQGPDSPSSVGELRYPEAEDTSYDDGKNEINAESNETSASIIVPTDVQENIIETKGDNDDLELLNSDNYKKADQKGNIITHQEEYAKIESLKNCDTISTETTKTIVKVNIDEFEIRNCEEEEELVSVETTMADQNNVTDLESQPEEKATIEEDINIDVKENFESNEADENVRVVETEHLETISDTEKLNDQVKDDDNTIDGFIEEKKTSGEKEGTSNIEVIQHKMDLETAAITIQKVFRTFLFKSKTMSIDDATNVDINLFINDRSEKVDGSSSIGGHKERRGISRKDTVLQTVNEEKSLSLSTDDSSTMSSAATVIQAHIRGFLVRNKLNIEKSPTSDSLVESDGLSGNSLENGDGQNRAKTVLNIHIVPERDFISRDESLLTSMDLSMDENLLMSLHPHSYDASERRKQLKREDAVQSVSPPSNNSSKLSEDIDSVKEALPAELNGISKVKSDDLKQESIDSDLETHEIQTAVEKEDLSPLQSIDKSDETSDLSNTVTPVTEKMNSVDDDTGSLKHSGEFHEAILPTKVSRSDTSIVREFQNVFAYFLLWD